MRILLSLAIVFTVVSSHAVVGLSCVDIFTSRAPWAAYTESHSLSTDVLKLLNENKPQEAAWLLEQRGFTKEAQALAKEITADLDLANSMPYTPAAWKNQLGTEKNNRHTSYLIDVGRVKGVLKFGETNFVTEALAYEIGKILHLKVPASRGVVIDGHKASLQYYIAGRPTVDKVLGEVPFKTQVEFFDLLLMNADRNGANLLADQPFVKGTPKSIYEKAEQILIDNEAIFAFHPLLWTPKQSELIDFIIYRLPELKKENPELAKTLSLAKTERQIVALINASQLPNKDQAITHVQTFLGAYQWLYKSAQAE